MTVLVYTFRTFPHIEKLQAHFETVIVLDKLKLDLQKICSYCKQNQPSKIIGIASANKVSTFEAVTGNSFHKRKVVQSIAQTTTITLTIPKTLPFGFCLAKKPTTSFCNYSLFTLGHFLHQEKLHIPLFFSHVTSQDLDVLLDWIASNKL